MGQVAFQDPMEIGRDGNDAILVAAADVGNLRSIDTMAQIWQPGKGYSEPDRLQVMFKFLYDFVETIPPQPWTEPNVG